MSWVLDLSMALAEDFDIVGPGLAYMPGSESVFVNIPVCLDAYRKDKGSPPIDGSIPYSTEYWLPVLLSTLDVLKEDGRVVRGVCLKLDRGSLKGASKNGG